MDRYTELDRVAHRFPLGSCVKSDYLDNLIYGRVVSWTLHNKDIISLDIISVPGHYIQHVLPSQTTIIQPSDMPDYTKENHHA